MKDVGIYLNFNGNTEEAFNFYKDVFEVEFLGDIYRLGTTPDADKLPEEVKNMIMHICIKLPNGTLLMGTDAPEQMGFNVNFGNNVYTYLDTDSREEADKLFNRLSEGGKIEMEMQDMFWGSYFGSCADKYGILWMVSYTENPGM